MTLADKLGHGWIDREDIGVIEGTDFDLYAQNIREGVSREIDMKSGPTQEAYMRQCSAYGVKPKAHFGGQLNGNDAQNFVKVDFSQFWAHHVTDNSWLPYDKKCVIQSRLSTNKVVSDTYRKFYKIIASTSAVNHEELPIIERDIGLFMFAYRRAFNTVPPKVDTVQKYCMKTVSLTKST